LAALIAKKNPHYECKMNKVYFTMNGTYPVFMTHTKRVAGILLK